MYIITDRCHHYSLLCVCINVYTHTNAHTQGNNDKSAFSDKMKEAANLGAHDYCVCVCVCVYVYM